MKTIYYWCPFVSRVATVRSVIKSAESLKKYSNKKFEPVIINVAGEWNNFTKNTNHLNIRIIKLTNSNILDESNWTGFIKSRIIYLYIFFLAIIPLYNFLNKKKPEYIIIHLISSLPLFLNFLLNLKTKIILRISGIPKLNLVRNLFWRVVLKKTYLITSPTIATLQDLKKKNFYPNKLVLLNDPILTPSEIVKKKNEKSKIQGNYFISVGRLTKQKNFEFLIKNISKKIKKNSKILLFIFGNGEEEKKLRNLISKLGLENNIKFFKNSENIYNYLCNSRGFILSSLWEDPGFVLVEAAYLNVPILSSDCKNGPREILNYGKNGILFKSNDPESFSKKFDEFLNLDNNKKKVFQLNAKKYIKRFSLFSHFLQIQKILT